MKAIRFYEIGGPEVMRFEDVELAGPGPGQVRVRHSAVAINFRDILVRRGQHAVQALPSGLGTEAAGVVDAVGPDVAELAVGDRVACVCRPESAYAEARVVPAARVLKLPASIDDRTAASMMVRGMTARYLLRSTYRVEPGDTIVVHAAAGGVGLILSQWAKHLGAIVVGTVGSDAKEAIARAHGCDHVFRYDNFMERTRELTGGKGAAVVYDFARTGDVRRVAARASPAGNSRLLWRGLRRSPDPVPPRRLGPPRLDLHHASEPALTTPQTRADLVEVAK